MWDPDLCPTVCQVRAELAGGEGICLLQLAPKHTVLRAPDGTQHVLIEHCGGTIQLAVTGADIGCPVRITITIPIRAGQLAARLWTIKNLSKLVTEGRLHLSPVPPVRHRLRIVLQALDASLAGAEHREISGALFGAERTDADWTDPSEYLQDAVRRAVRRGRRLMLGGYKQLLRQIF